MGNRGGTPGGAEGAARDPDQRPGHLCLEVRSRRGRGGQKEGKPGKCGVMDTEEGRVVICFGFCQRVQVSTGFATWRVLVIVATAILAARGEVEMTVFPFVNP